MSLCFRTASKADGIDCEEPITADKPPRLMYVWLTGTMKNESKVCAWLLYVQETKTQDKAQLLIYVGLRCLAIESPETK